MRVVLAVLLPLLVQLLGFWLVILVSQGGGSFVGLLALSAAVITVPGVAIINWSRTQKVPPFSARRLVWVGCAIALVVPMLLGLLRVIEPHL